MLVDYISVLMFRTVLLVVLILERGGLTVGVCLLRGSFECFGLRVGLGC